MNLNILKQILKLSDTPTLIIDQNNKIIFFNQSTTTLFEHFPIHLGCDFFDTFRLAKKSSFPLSIDINIGELTKEKCTLEKQQLADWELVFIKLTNQTMLQRIATLNDELFDFKVFFDYSYDGVMIVDGQGYGRRINASYSRVTGLADAPKMIGMHMSDAERLGYTSESVSLKVLRERNSVSLHPKMGKDQHVLMTGVPVFDRDGNIVRVIANVRDISELNHLHNQIEIEKRKAKIYLDELNKFKNNQDFIAESPIMRKAVNQALKLAKTDLSVIITGSSGVGKEVIAKLIHDNSDRAKYPFIKINCGAIPENLLESELFGYEKGAFTSASPTGKQGLFELAKQGTLFLDEIGEIPLTLQAKLLGVLQDKRFLRVGGIKEKNLEARILAATNQNLEDMIENKLFRKDLYYRLLMSRILIPDLSSRQEDIFPLIMFYIKKYNQKYNKKITLPPYIMNKLICYDWPGNVRQLSAVVEQIVALSEHDIITINDIPSTLYHDIQLIEHSDKSLRSIIENIEKQIFSKYMAENYSSYKIADILGISQATAIRKMQKYKNTNVSINHSNNYSKYQI